MDGDGGEIVGDLLIRRVPMTAGGLDITEQALPPEFPDHFRADAKTHCRLFSVITGPIRRHLSACSLTAGASRAVAGIRSLIGRKKPMGNPLEGSGTDLSSNDEPSIPHSRTLSPPLI